MHTHTQTCTRTRTHTHTHTPAHTHTHSCNPPSGLTRITWYAVFPTQRSRTLRGLWLSLLPSSETKILQVRGSGVPEPYQHTLKSLFVRCPLFRCGASPCFKRLIPWQTGVPHTHTHTDTRLHKRRLNTRAMPTPESLDRLILPASGEILPDQDRFFAGTCCYWSERTSTFRHSFV